MIKEVGGVTIKPKHRAMCHCGSVELELELAHGIVHRQLTPHITGSKKWCGCSKAEAAPLFAVRVYVFVRLFWLP